MLRNKFRSVMAVQIGRAIYHTGYGVPSTTMNRFDDFIFKGDRFSEIRCSEISFSEIRCREIKFSEFAVIL